MSRATKKDELISGVKRKAKTQRYLKFDPVFKLMDNFIYMQLNPKY